MRWGRAGLCGMVFVGALALGACTTTSGTAPTTTASTSGQSGASNLTVTDAVRSQLLGAGAAYNGVPVSEYSGLASGLTYYAYDSATETYWAGARLSPVLTPADQPPSQAEISAQDAGSYLIFSQPKGGAWKAYAAGNTGQGTPCPVTVPAPVLAVWGWPAAGCRPSGA
jgi:hypothetical protein